MELTNEFRVGVPVERAWEVLTDVERIAPCMPGAQLQEIEGDEYRGIVKVKVGPITAQYKGAARFVEQDEAAHRAVLRAEGRDTQGPGQRQRHDHRHSSTPDGDGTAVVGGDRPDRSPAGWPSSAGACWPTCRPSCSASSSTASRPSSLADEADVGAASAAEPSSRASSHGSAPPRPATARSTSRPRARPPPASARCRGRRHGRRPARRTARPVRMRPTARRVNGTSGPPIRVVDCAGSRARRPPRRRRGPGRQAAGAGRRRAYGAVAAERLPAPPPAPRAAEPLAPAPTRLGAEGRRARVFPLARRPGQPRRSGGIGRRARLRA